MKKGQKKTTKAHIERDSNLTKLRTLRKEFEQIFWSIDETQGVPSIKDYLVILMYQNLDIIRLLETLTNGR